MQDETQTTEVRETNSQVGDTTVQRQAVVKQTQSSGVVIAQRVVWFVIGLVTTVIALRFVFLLLGANRGAGFTEFIYALSDPFVAPFVGIFGRPDFGVSVFEISSILAIVVYLLLGWGIAKLITIARPQDEI